jgi:pimeloyl-[acyl-carrier protein] methyl ester esterase
MKFELMIKTIYSEIKGNGHNVVLLHGWGMHGGLWGKFNELLSESYQIHTLDLPGFGFSKDVKNEFTLDALTEAVEDYIKTLTLPVIFIGWSLGGLIAQNILKRKNINLSKVVLIATTPSFTKKEGWHAAMEQSVFDDFSNDLELDYKKTLKRFLSLQTRGSNLSRDDLRELNVKLMERGEPNKKALENGLKILSETDLRNESISEVPLMIVLGEKDTLVPVSVKNEFKKMFPRSEYLILEKAGHAPFISKSDLCAEKIKNFINE